MTCLAVDEATEENSMSSLYTLTERMDDQSSLDSLLNTLVRIVKSSAQVGVGDATEAGAS